MAALLADAFDQDPVFTFLFPPESSRRHKRMTRLFGIHVVRSHRLGGAWVSDDGSGAAVWYPPGQWEPSDRESLRQLPQLFAAFGRRLPLAGRVLNALQEQHRRLDPHWYLYYLGTRPNAEAAASAHVSDVAKSPLAPLRLPRRSKP